MPAGHFYSPIVDPADTFVRNIASGHSRLELVPDESLSIDDAAMCRLFQTICSFSAQLEFPEHRSPAFRYFYDNPQFSFGDAAVYFGILLAFRPGRVIEAGSGYSSCLLMDTVDRHFPNGLNAFFIDPYPETLENLLAPDDPYRKFILRRPLQSVSTEFFRDLEANDILFIDSSHVAKTGSDVNDYLFRILPALKDGVLIHIHDIPYPFEYGPAWIDEENRSWNEAYALRAFLQYNQRFEVIYFNHYMYRKHADLLENLPLCLRNCGASLWLRKKPAGARGGFSLRGIVNRFRA